MVLKELKNYVYIYSHPITNEIFYVGKGKGNRVFAHLTDEKESEKVIQLNELKKEGLKPKIEILIHGIENNETVEKIEMSIIDLIGIDNLTNKQKGKYSAKNGRMSIEQINAIYQMKEVKIEEPCVLIRINKMFRYSMSPMELYDFTRGIWRVNLENATKAKYAFAIYDGIVQEVYEIVKWFPAGSTFNTRIDYESHEDYTTGEGVRCEFVGNLAPKKIRDKYKYKSVSHYFKQGNQNPIKYENT